MNFRRYYLTSKWSWTTDHWATSRMTSSWLSTLTLYCSWLVTYSHKWSETASRLVSYVKGANTCWSAEKQSGVFELKNTCAASERGIVFGQHQTVASPLSVTSSLSDLRTRIEGGAHSVSLKRKLLGMTKLSEERDSWLGGPISSDQSNICTP